MKNSNKLQVGRLYTLTHKKALPLNNTPDIPVEFSQFVFSHKSKRTTNGQFSDEIHRCIFINPATKDIVLSILEEDLNNDWDIELHKVELLAVGIPKHYYRVCCMITPTACAPVAYSAAISEPFEKFIERNKVEGQRISIQMIQPCAEQEYELYRLFNPTRGSHCNLSNGDYKSNKKRN